MKIGCLKARFMNIGGLCEFQLPNGKHILVDPWFTDLDTGDPWPFPGGQTKEDIERVDYILLSHTHADHDFDLGWFVKKFDCPVFCNVMVADELIRYHKLPYDNVFPLYPGETFTNEDFSLQTFNGKHNAAPGRCWPFEHPMPTMTGRRELQHLGSLHEIDFLITTNNNFRILISGGRVVKEELFDLCRKNGPNLLLRQSGFRKWSEDGSKMVQVSPRELAEVYCKYRPQLIVPYHQEIMQERIGEAATASYFAEVAREVLDIDPGAAMLYPKPWQWYNLTLSVEEAE